MEKKQVNEEIACTEWWAKKDNYGTTPDGRAAGGQAGRQASK